MNPGLLSTLSWLLPLLGVGLYVVAVPAFRRNLARPVERLRDVFFGPVVSTLDEEVSEASPAPRKAVSRADDPEVTRFPQDIYAEFPDPDDLI